MNKKVFIILIVLFLTQTAKTQDIEKCRKIIKLTFQSVNKKSITEIENYLSPDFEIANQKGKIAKIVLRQLVSQLNDSIIEYKEKNVVKTNTSLSFN